MQFLPTGSKLAHIHWQADTCTCICIREMHIWYEPNWRYIYKIDMRKSYIYIWIGNNMHTKHQRIPFVIFDWDFQKTKKTKKTNNNENEVGHLLREWNKKRVTVVSHHWHWPTLMKTIGSYTCDLRKMFDISCVRIYVCACEFISFIIQHKNKSHHKKCTLLEMSIGMRIHSLVEKKTTGALCTLWAANKHWLTQFS